MLQRIAHGSKLTARVIGVSVAALLAAAPVLADAQDNPAPAAPAPAAPQPAAATPVGAVEAPAQDRFTQAELEKLLAPIALFPDALLAQILPASAYPAQIVQAQRWLDKNGTAVANNDFSAVDTMKWDPSVKALVRFPDAIKKMSANLDWTTDLGDAFVNQPQDVTNTIQDLRLKAQTAGTLKTTPQQTVSRTTQEGRDVVSIAPTDPSVMYMPSYDPVTVYQPYTGVAPLLTFGTGIALGALATGAYWNWNRGWAYPPVWPGYPGYRPPYPGYRPGQPIRPGGINNGNI